ncbi:ras-related protein Rab-24-like isoform X2 [Amphibalanus amphitrite]|uniref:ras-related protein Rab-24-like isoform X2 n=1 Tax=Amphibalanus amphitrite TaxID=1232801 RepID=UPI001C917260|nr:ras-related protein Rab-24-like isoform X2 [Amphibalanus amphitrite]
MAAACPTIKVVMVGKAFAGKTCLCTRYLHKSFPTSNSNTVGAAYGAEYRFYKNDKIKFEIWDTAGSERYESWLPLYMRESTAAVVCYDLTNAEHWEKAKKYVDEIKLRVEGCRIYLVGTKLDVIQKQGRTARQVDFHDAVDYADSVRAVCVLETSSLTGYNVVEVFDRIFNDCAADVVRQFRESRAAGGGQSVRLGAGAHRGRCCP